MKKLSFKYRSVVPSLFALVTLVVSQCAVACGGFFCSLVPIDQAAEQIVFRQEGSETTALIKIDYVGNAEDFGWVLPVPNTPDISLGSDQIFTDLELATRPQFILERVGQPCFFPAPSSGSSSSSSSSSSASSGGTGVVVEKVLSVGPFDAQVISSDNAQALATWLADNNLDLTERGDELLDPYIQAQSKFVVLKLKNNSSVGSIQPVILKYQSSTPVIPMTLTAVAAQDNMGVLVWLLGEGRGVPNNYKHVTPNYTRLNWFSGTRAAYVSYQSLITAAMDEAGGQGFATDFAGYMPNLEDSLTSPEVWENALSTLENSSDAVFIEEMWLQRNAVVQNAIQAALPTSSSFVFFDAVQIANTFSAQQLSEARAAVTQTVYDQIISPLENSIDILNDDLYLTRLYTTLSADEMGVNPEFTFNTAMPDQQLNRNATLTASCSDEGISEWTLKLGEGTGREDEVVVDAWDWPIPFGPVQSSQESSWRVEKTSATADPVLLAENDFKVLKLGERPQIDNPPSNSTKGGAVDTFVFLLAVLSVWVGFVARSNKN